MDAARIDYDAFRDEVRAFARAHCPPEIRTTVAAGDKLTKTEFLGWQRVLAAHGWRAPGWPTEFGGMGWDIRQRMIFEEVMSEEDCPPLYHHGFGHIGPVIIRFGTPAQQQRYLPRILDGTHWWCQGYSEPNAGSDLASLRTEARRAAGPDGEHYVVNGQKIWTSHAHEANMIYTLVRTSREGRKQEGISLLLIPLDSPGIRVRPIRTMDGWHHVNEVFFDDVQVPVENRIGEENKGWQCAKYLLERERLPAASVARLTSLWKQVAARLDRAIAANDGRRDLSGLRYRLLQSEAEIAGAHAMLESATDDLIHQRPLGAKPSALKQQVSEVGQRLVGIALDAVGPGSAMRFMPDADVVDPDAIWVHNYYYYRSKTIAGGTSEVQRNVIARELFDVSTRPCSTIYPGMLFDSAERFAADAAGHDDAGAAVAREGADAIADMGWALALIPESMGGLGGSLADVAGIVEGLAVHGNPLPVIDRVAVAPTLLLAAAGADRPAGSWIEGLVNGRMRIATLPAGSVVATQVDGGLGLQGLVRGVDAGKSLTHIVVPVRIESDGGSDALVIVDVDTLQQDGPAWRTMDGRPSRDLRLAGLVVAEDRIIARGGDASRAIARAEAAALALIGVDSAALLGTLVAQTVTYLNGRVQFGVALSTFQALRHQLVDVYIRYESARGMVTRLIADAVAAGAVDRRRARLTKLAIGEGARASAETVIQLHGGMGMSEEMPAARLAGRLLANEFRYGDRLTHSAALTAAV
jgi:alkylation response protein AidB-like acyl-CoA dehydrogenase